MNQLITKSLVICGPSGVGKGTLINKLLTQYPSKFGLSVSHTSRKPRPGEIDHVHYHFVDKESLRHDIANGPFKYLEFAEVHSNLYGTREDDVMKVHDSGRICVLDVDSNGVKQIKGMQYPAKTVFIAPPSVEALENRLRTRATESEDQVQLRLKNARAELEYGLAPGNFDEIVVNDVLDESYETLLNHIRDWFPYQELPKNTDNPRLV